MDIANKYYKNRYVQFVHIFDRLAKYPIFFLAPKKTKKTNVFLGTKRSSRVVDSKSGRGGRPKIFRECQEKCLFWVGNLDLPVLIPSLPATSSQWPKRSFFIGTWTCTAIHVLRVYGNFVAKQYFMGMSNFRGNVEKSSLREAFVTVVEIYEKSITGKIH